MSLEEVLKRISSISEEEWKKMSVDEIEKLKQFVPTEHMKKVDRDRNITVIMSLISEKLRMSFLTTFVKNNESLWNETFRVSSLVDSDSDFEEQLAQSMHDDVWLKNYRQRMGNKKKWVDLPRDVFMTSAGVRDSIKKLMDEGHKNLRIDPVTQRIQQNIAIPFIEIHPALRQRLNGGLSKRYIEIIEFYLSLGDLTEEHLVEMGEAIHKAFLLENRWHLESSFKRLVGRSALNMTLPEIFEVIKGLDKNAWLTLSETEKEKYKQFVPTEELPWLYHRGNFLMLEQTLKAYFNLKKHPVSSEGSVKLEAPVSCDAPFQQ